MAVTLLKLATAVFIATVGIQAAPTEDNVDMIARQAAPVVVNGDFSAPLQGTWSFSNYGPQPANAAQRVRVNGNQVLQILGKDSCPMPAQRTRRVDYEATVNNLQGGQQYLLSFQYRFLESNVYSLWQYTSITGCRSNQASYTKNAKANVWYTFTIVITVQEGRTGPQTLRSTYINCDAGGGPHPTVQRKSRSQKLPPGVVTMPDTGTRSKTCHSLTSSQSTISASSRGKNAFV